MKDEDFVLVTNKARDGATIHAQVIGRAGPLCGTRLRRASPWEVFDYATVSCRNCTRLLDGMRVGDRLLAAVFGRR